MALAFAGKFYGTNNAEAHAGGDARSVLKVSRFDWHDGRCGAVNQGYFVNVFVFHILNLLCV